MAKDHLQGALKELHLALGEQEIADIEAAKQVLARVPQAARDRATAVAQLDLQIGIAVAIRPKLLIDDEIHFVDRLAIGKLLDETPCHGFRPCSFR